MQTVTASPKARAQIARRVVLLVFLYSIPIFQAMIPIVDLDIWWRLRTGEWIVENRAIPFVDVFFTQGVEKNWIEYSWLFEVIVYAVHAQLGLSGLVYFVVAIALVIAFSIHQVVRHGGLPIHLEVPLVAAALLAIKPLMTPRPWLFTIMFFLFELQIIARVRGSGNDRQLWFLPPLFALWANLHIQFVYGLAVLGLLLAEALLKTCGEWFGFKLKAPALRPGGLSLVTLACFGATLLTPFHYLLYRQIFEYIGQAQAFQYITELHAMYFRSADNWCVLWLTVTATFVLGWQRKWLPFPTFLLIMAAMLAFRGRRDVWILVHVAVYIISHYLPSFSSGRPFQISKGQAATCALAVVFAAYFAGRYRQISEDQLQAVVASRFPVKAVEYIKKNRLAGPLFNDYDWGGFLLWSLRELPVMTDGRLNLFRYERLERLSNTWQGRPGWESNADFLNAKVIISQRARPLASLLHLQPGYKIVYQDNTAVVFVRRP